MNSRHKIPLLTAALLALCSIAWFYPQAAEAGAEIFERDDRKCIRCHTRREPFPESPPPGEVWEVHLSLDQFIEEAHQPLACDSCHDDLGDNHGRGKEESPEAEKTKLTVDCVSCHRRHPEFVLRDADGEPVVESGRPLSTLQTCAVCHDTEYIASSSDHANAGAAQLYPESERSRAWEAGPGYFGGWEPLRYQTTLDAAGAVDAVAWLETYGARHVGGGPVGHLVEMNCLLCHTDIEDHSRRAELVSGGEFEWANSAPLEEADILQFEDGTWQWNEKAFQQDGRLHVGVLAVRNPDTSRCAQCHGLASNDPGTPLVLQGALEDNLVTERTGQIIAPHTLAGSGLNFAEELPSDHPLDVHLANGLECSDCHYLLNDPVYFRQAADSRPDHMRFDPRRPERADFLDRPTHQFAKGQSIHGLAAEDSVNTLRDCKSCHDAGAVHDWLPYRARHFDALGCEACHVPWVPGPALKAIDWTVVDEAGEPLRQYRGIEGDPGSEDALITGYRPVLLPRIGMNGERELTPYNGVTAWYWLTGNPPRPVTPAELEAALLSGDGHHPDLVAAFDRNGDARLERSELELVSPEQQAIVQARLEASGLDSLSVGTEVTPYPIFHNVGSDDFANRDCESCHHRDAFLQMPFELSSYIPGGVLPRTRGYENVEIIGTTQIAETGAISGIPDLKSSGYYILGMHSVAWIDQLGLLIFCGVVLGVVAHGLVRYLFARKRPKYEVELKRIYLYDVYERIWHWVQAFMILYLIFSGLLIHKPHLFEGFSYPFLVESHNLFGFILLINAGLALFYNLASGRFKQYLPEPKDFFARSIMQVMYYTRGIFKGEHHPFEKTRYRRLNPLQEVTYFMILNVLLPAQVVTGLMIYWGQQNWPWWVTDLGGLPVLSPLHTAIAWLFASFVVMHVYLTTASGRRPMSAIRSMVIGYEHVERRKKRTGDSSPGGDPETNAG